MCVQSDSFAQISYDTGKEEEKNREGHKEGPKESKGERRQARRKEWKGHPCYLHYHHNLSCPIMNSTIKKPQVDSNNPLVGAKKECALQTGSYVCHQSAPVYMYAVISVCVKPCT